MGISPRDAPFIRALSSPFSSFSSPSFGRRKEAYNRVIFWQDPYLSGLQFRGWNRGRGVEELESWSRSNVFFHSEYILKFIYHLQGRII